LPDQQFQFEIRRLWENEMGSHFGAYSHNIQIAEASINNPETRINGKRIISRPQLIKKSFGLYEVRHVEALGKSIIDRGEKIDCLSPLAPLSKEPPEIMRGAQLQRGRFLAAGDLERTA
jgi:hypothetical protein